MRIARIIATVYLVVGMIMFSLQSRIIFPGQDTQGRPEAQVRPRLGAELVRLRSPRGVSIAALYGPALEPDGEPDPDATDRPTLLYFYGNGMCLNDTTAQFEGFRRLGLNVMIPEYVGYGMSGGKPSERGCRETADASYEYLVTTRRVPAARVVVGGWSLGGAIAIDLAARRPVEGLIALSSFTSGVEMARRIVPFLPASLLLRHRFDSIKKIPGIDCPILIGHGRRDGIVPFEMGERLARAAMSPVTTLWVEDADHNDFFQVAGTRVDRAILRFVDQIFGDDR